MADGKDKGKSNGVRFALPILSGGISVADLVLIKNALSIPLETKTLPNIQKVTFAVGALPSVRLIAR